MSDSRDVERFGLRAMPYPDDPPKTGPTRDEHLAWCKKRALEYADRGDADQAFNSMASDLSKHPDTRGHIGIELGSMLLFAGHLKGDELRRWITGFN